jgi:hypothetical protein
VLDDPIVATYPPLASNFWIRSFWSSAEVFP